MDYIETPFKDLFICKPTIYGDSRGYFYESFNASHFKEKTNINVQFVQDNQSLSAYGVIRGFHMQVGDHAQAKLVRCIKGRILDVVVDLRKEEPTFGQHYAIELSSENHLQLYIPRGFAHGFSVLSEEALFIYKCDNYYHKESEVGIDYNDATLAIDWKIPKEKQIISEKDCNNPSYKDVVNRYFKL